MFVFALLMLGLNVSAAHAEESAGLDDEWWGAVAYGHDNGKRAQGAGWAYTTRAAAEAAALAGCQKGQGVALCTLVPGGHWEGADVCGFVAVGADDLGNVSWGFASGPIASAAALQQQAKTDCEKGGFSCTTPVSGGCNTDE
jgi:hypothetical protein